MPEPAVPSSGDGPHRVLVVGDLLVDVVVVPDGAVRPGSDTAATIRSGGGGSAANTAAWLAWSGRSVSLLAAVGDDLFGTSARSELAAHGVEHLGPVLLGARTGACVVVVDPAGERTMLPDRGANDLLGAELTGVLLDDAGLPLGDVAWVHLSGYTLLHPGSRPAGEVVVRQARDAGIGLSVDAASAGPICDLGAGAFLDRVRGAEVLFANEAELDALGGPDAVLGAVGALVTKRGAAGASWTDGREVLDVRAKPVEVVDTTGAGDAFAAGVLAAWLAGTTVRDALEGGAIRAAEAVARPGGRPHGGDPSPSPSPSAAS